MKRILLSAMIFAGLGLTCFAQESVDATSAAVRAQLKAYVETYNKRNANAVAEYWTTDALSVQEESGERTEGREALRAEFKQFFADYPNTQLSGVVEHVRTVGTNVAVAEGEMTLVTDPGEPSQSAFTAVLEKQNNQWLIASSHERDLPSPPTSYDALKEFEWFIGSWQDQTEGALVNTTVRWSPSRAFLIRSYLAEFADGDSFSGTQIFGWDPLAKQIRSWTFNSDGSYGDGVVSKSGDDWLVKMNQMQSDGRVASGTSVITQVDDNTIQIQKIGESVDGEPVPTSDPVTVVRIADTEKESAVIAPATEGAGQ
jgi:uncharacterized protein (TIGR02246 family)